MTHAQKPDLVFQRNGRVHLNRRGCQFSRLLAVEECGSADSDCIDHVPTYIARLLATHSIRIFPLHFPSRASPCAIRFWTRYIPVNCNSSVAISSYPRGLLSRRSAKHDDDYYYDNTEHAFPGAHCSSFNFFNASFTPATFHILAVT